LRAELAKEEYATTWQEEEQGQPQEERVGPEIHRRPQRKALDTLARRRIAEDKCAKERGAKERSAKGSGAKGSGQTQHQTERHGPQGFADSAPRGSSCGRSRQ